MLLWYGHPSHSGNSCNSFKKIYIHHPTFDHGRSGDDISRFWMIYIYIVCIYIYNLTGEKDLFGKKNGLVCKGNCRKLVAGLLLPQYNQERVRNGLVAWWLGIPAGIEHPQPVDIYIYIHIYIYIYIYPGGKRLQRRTSKSSKIIQNPIQFLGKWSMMMCLWAMLAPPEMVMATKGILLVDLITPWHAYVYYV